MLSSSSPSSASSSRAPPSAFSYADRAKRTQPIAPAISQSDPRPLQVNGDAQNDPPHKPPQQPAPVPNVWSIRKEQMAQARRPQPLPSTSASASTLSQSLPPVVSSSAMPNTNGLHRRTSNAGSMSLTNGALPAPPSTLNDDVFVVSPLRQPPPPLLAVDDVSWPEVGRPAPIITSSSPSGERTTEAKDPEEKKDNDPAENDKTQPSLTPRKSEKTKWKQIPPEELQAAADAAARARSSSSSSPSQHPQHPLRPSHSRNTSQHTRPRQQFPQPHQHQHQHSTSASVTASASASTPTSTQHSRTHSRIGSTHSSPRLPNPNSISNSIPTRGRRLPDDELSNSTNNAYNNTATDNNNNIGAAMGVGVRGSRGSSPLSYSGEVPGSGVGIYPYAPVVVPAPNGGAGAPPMFFPPPQHLAQHQQREYSPSHTSYILPDVYAPPQHQHQGYPVYGAPYSYGYIPVQSQGQGQGQGYGYWDVGGQGHERQQGPVFGHAGTPSPPDQQHPHAQHYHVPHPHQQHYHHLSASHSHSHSHSQSMGEQLPGPGMMSTSMLQHNPESEGVAVPVAGYPSTVGVNGSASGTVFGSGLGGGGYHVGNDGRAMTSGTGTGVGTVVFGSIGTSDMRTPSPLPRSPSPLQTDGGLGLDVRALGENLKGDPKTNAYGDIRGVDMDFLDRSFTTFSIGVAPGDLPAKTRKRERERADTAPGRYMSDVTNGSGEVSRRRGESEGALGHGKGRGQGQVKVIDLTDHSEAPRWVFGTAEENGSERTPEQTLEADLPTQELGSGSSAGLGLSGEMTLSCEHEQEYVHQHDHQHQEYISPAPPLIDDEHIHMLPNSTPPPPPPLQPSYIHNQDAYIPGAPGDEWQVKDYGYGGYAASMLPPPLSREERADRDRDRPREYGRPRRGSFGGYGGYERGGYGGRRGRGFGGRGNYGNNSRSFVPRGGFQGQGQGHRHSHSATQVQLSPPPPAHLEPLPVSAPAHEVSNGFYGAHMPLYAAPLPGSGMGTYGGTPGVFDGQAQAQIAAQTQAQAQVPLPIPLTILSFPLDPTRFYLLGQLEYYFSVQNLAQDFFFRQQMDARGWIPISLIASFNRVRQLTVDVQLVKDVMALSAVVEVCGEWVRLRERAWEPFVLPGAPASVVDDGEGGEREHDHALGQGQGQGYSEVYEQGQLQGQGQGEEDGEGGEVEEEEEDIVFVMGQEGGAWTPERTGSQAVAVGGQR